MTNYQSSTEQGKCIFCEIAKGNIKPIGDGTFYEDEKYMAWLTPFPSVIGFTVVLPKKHYASDVLAMPNDVLPEFILVAKKVANILLKHFTDVGRIGFVMEGMGVDHAHIKLIPLHGTGHLKQGVWKQYLSGRSDFFTKYEGYLLMNRKLKN